MEELERKLEDRIPRGYQVLHRPQVEDFLSAIQEGRQPTVGVAECRQVLNVTTGIYKSAITGEVVPLPISRNDEWYSALPPAGSVLKGAGL